MVWIEAVTRSYIFKMPTFGPAVAKFAIKCNIPSATHETGQATQTTKRRGSMPYGTRVGVLSKLSGSSDCNERAIASDRHSPRGAKFADKRAFQPDTTLGGDAGQGTEYTRLAAICPEIRVQQMIPFGHRHPSFFSRQANAVTQRGQNGVPNNERNDGCQIRDEEKKSDTRVIPMLQSKNDNLCDALDHAGRTCGEIRSANALLLLGGQA
jgi:hypothetical protein